jgi:SAM-dependent methyltransferase
LAQNTVNAFFYEENKGGEYSVIDLALCGQRPIALRSDMFRHILHPYLHREFFKTIIHNGIEPLLPFENGAENLIWDYERIISEILADASTHIGKEIFSISDHCVQHFSKIKGSGRSLPADSWIPKIQADAQLPSIMQRDKYLFTSLPGITTLNRILDNEARLQYKPVIDKLFEIVPDMMSHKISEANVQQAFVLDTVFRFAHRLSSPKMLCIGSYDDTAAASLKQLGFQMDEVDPVLNYDLNTFYHKPTTSKGRYDIIFSTSVIEHVKNDELFITQIVELLAPDGVAILTCDYNDQYKPGDKIPNEDFRLYTQNDFKHRFLPLLKNCYLIDEPQWDCPRPDFHYAGCKYTFATLVFKKNAV